MWGRKPAPPSSPTPVDPWEGGIGCEGGPVIIANADDFRHWTGGEPLPLAQRKSVHWWSTFAAEIPERFRPDGPGGHQYLFAASLDELMRLRDDVLAYVTDRWPGTRVTRKSEPWVARRRDGGKLSIELDPASEYDRACKGLDELRIHRYAADSTALVWFVEPGVVNVRRTLLGRRLELLQLTAADDEIAGREAMEHVRLIEADAGEAALTFTIDPGPVVVAWAPNSFGDYKGNLRWDHLTARDPGLGLDLSTNGSGALLALEAGTYAVSHGTHEAETWWARWCVLTAPAR